MHTATHHPDPQTPLALPADLTLGPVHLTIPDVDASVAWYERALGLVTGRRDGSSAALGDGIETVVVLHEDATAREPGREAGLYHFALLYPTREALARAAMRLAATQTRIQGASDHRTHEAIYLGDLDGNGIELAADRPRDQWPRGLGYDGGPAPLDFDSLLSTTRGEPLPAHVDAGLRVGHLHLHVGDVAQGLAFYRDILGFELQANLGTAAFVSAGGYHHHLGFNTWRGQGVPAGGDRTIGLQRWTVALPTSADVREVRARLRAAGIAVDEIDGGLLVRDPWNIALAVVSDG